MRRHPMAAGVIIGAKVASNKAAKAAPPPNPPPQTTTTTVIVTDPQQPYPPQQQPYYPPQQPPYPPNQQYYPPQQPYPQYDPYPPQQSYPPQPYPPPPHNYPPPPQQYPPPTQQSQQYPPPPPMQQQQYPHPQQPPPAAEIKVATVVAPEKKAEKKERRYFMIVNEATCEVLEIEDHNKNAGAKISTEKRHHDAPSHQVWYFDENEILRSKMNDFAVQSKDNGGGLFVAPYNGDARQQWIIKGNKLVNKVFCNDCIGLKKGLVRIKDDVIVDKYAGKPYQHWRLDFI